MKILLLGKDGQVGWELQRSLAVVGEVVALDRHGEQGLVGDLNDTTGLAATVRAVRPSVIVNAAAYTAVDKAESEPALARAINTEAPDVLATEAKSLGALLVHYSTDYVFDGSGHSPWTEDSVPAPLSIYGATKLGGEEAIRASGCLHLILRTSWVYGARGNNFPRTMLRLAMERDELGVVADQFGAPTGADLLADATAHAVRTFLGNTNLSGTYHLAASGETNWWEYASFVIEHARSLGAPVRVAKDAVRPILSSDYPTRASRPLNSRLDSSKFTDAFGLALPAWRGGVARMLEEGSY